MRLAALLLTLAGGLIALVTVCAVFLVVTGQSLVAQLGLAALLALAIIALAWTGSYASSQTRNAGLVLILLSAVALVLGAFSPVFALRPLLVGYALSLIGGIVTLFVSRRAAMA